MFCKNLCDKVSKMKNLRLLFSSFFRALRHGVLHFYGQRIFHGENWETKSPVLTFLKKCENWWKVGAIFDIFGTPCIHFFYIRSVSGPWSQERDIRFANPIKIGLTRVGRVTVNWGKIPAIYNGVPVLVLVTHMLLPSKKGGCSFHVVRVDACAKFGLTLQSDWL